MSGGAGQASVDLLGGAAAVILAGLVGLQLLGAGYAAVMADHSAQAAAMALAAGRPARAAALEAVPGWPERALRVRSGTETVRVSLEPPSLLRLVGRRIAVEGRAAVVAGPAGDGREGDADGRAPGLR